MCVCTNSRQIQTVIKCAEHLLQISNTKIHLNLRFEVLKAVDMKVTVFQHTRPLTSEECASSIFNVTSKIKIAAAHSFKLFVCVMPKYIKEDPNLH
jgi:hypothetical protein